MLNLTRVRQWASRLDALLSERLHTPFEWGTHDCCLFGADAVIATTDVDPAGALRGSYSTEEGARQVLAERGGVSGIATATFGPAVTPLLARVGDLGLVVNGDSQTLAVCIGQQWCAAGPDGLVLVRAAHVSACWRVG